MAGVWCCSRIRIFQKIFYVLKSALLNDVTVTPKNIHLVCFHIQLMISRTEYLMAGEADEKWKTLQEQLNESFRKATIIKNLHVKDTTAVYKFLLISLAVCVIF